MRCWPQRLSSSPIWKVSLNSPRAANGCGCAYRAALKLPALSDAAGVLPALDANVRRVWRVAPAVDPDASGGQGHVGEIGRAVAKGNTFGITPGGEQGGNTTGLFFTAPVARTQSPVEFAVGTPGKFGADGFTKTQRAANL